MLGQKVPKTNTLATNLPLLHWADLFCDSSHSHSSVGSSQELGRYPPNMMKGIAEAVCTHSELWPLSLASASADRPLVSSASLSLDPESDTMLTQVGFRTRPLWDGGGKPSLGRLTPPKRQPSPLSTLGQKIMKVICSSDLRLRALQPSLAVSPFSEATLSELRRQSWIAACSSLDKGKSTSGLNFLSMEKKEPGQPFCLDLIRLLLEASHDPDLSFLPRWPQEFRLVLRSKPWTLATFGQLKRK